MAKVEELFGHKINADSEDWAVLSEAFIEVDVPPNTKLIEKGQVEHYLSTIVYGGVRFYVNQEKVNKSIDFAFDGESASALDSYINKKPSYYGIESITATKLLRIHRDRLKVLGKQSNMASMFMQYHIESQYLKDSARRKSRLVDDVHKRFVELCSKYPTLTDQVKMKDIASYLDITPSTLSRIVKKTSS